MAWTTKPLGGGVKSLVVRPLKKSLFLCVYSLREGVKKNVADVFFDLWIKNQKY